MEHKNFAHLQVGRRSFTTHLGLEYGTVNL